MSPRSLTCVTWLCVLPQASFMSVCHVQSHRPLGLEGACVQRAAIFRHLHDVETRSSRFFYCTEPHQWCNRSSLPLFFSSPTALQLTPHTAHHPGYSPCSELLYLLFPLPDSLPQSSRDSHRHLLCVNVSVRHTLTAPFILQTISLWSFIGCIFFSLYLWLPHMVTFFLVMLFVYYQYFSLWDRIGFMKERIFICFFCFVFFPTAVWAWCI